MAVFTRVKTWVSNEVLTAAALNAEFNNLLNNTIPASIEDYSADVATMQITADPGGVATESLATTLAGEIARLRYVIKRLFGGAQWYSTPVSTLATGGILSAALADGSVTRAKQAAVGHQISAADSGSYSSASTTFVDVTNLTVDITTTGRPVIVMLQTSTTPAITSFVISTGEAQLKIVRGATDLGIYRFSPGVTVHSGVIVYLDAPAAGTYTYKIQGKTATGTLNVQDMVLVAYEL